MKNAYALGRARRESKGKWHGLPRVVIVLAGRALQIDRAITRASLEYVFLRFIVHAGLAKVVHGIGHIFRFKASQNKDAYGKFVQTVLGAFVPSLLKISNVCTQLACVVFERLDFISSRRLFFLELKRGVLNIDDPIVDRLCRLGELRIISYCDCRTHEVYRGLQGGERCANCCYDHGCSGCVGNGAVECTASINLTDEGASTRQSVSPCEAGKGVLRPKEGVQP